MDTAGRIENFERKYKVSRDAEEGAANRVKRGRFKPANARGGCVLP